jgi:hypothetical protein
MWEKEMAAARPAPWLNYLPRRSYRLADLLPVISRRINVRITAPMTAMMIDMINP